MNKLLRLVLLVFAIYFLVAGTLIRAQTFKRQNFGKRGSKRFGNRKNFNQQGIFDRFFSLDRDGNKILDSEEISSIRRPRAVKTMQMIDTNSDGSIPYQELVDFVIDRRNEAIEKVANKIKQKLIEKISQSNNPKKAEENFSWLKSKKSIFTILDRDQNNEIDKNEIEAALPELLALLYSKRISLLSKLIGQSPSKQIERRKLRIARLMDYNADDHISVSEFDRFLYRHIDKEVADKYALKNKSPNAQNSDAGANNTNYIIESLRKEAKKDATKPVEKTVQKPYKPIKTQKQPTKRYENKITSESTATKNQKADNFIIPAIKSFEDEIENDKDPLVDLLGAGADEELLW
jgi:Ca2+-binding EF-hand superfamily protein